MALLTEMSELCDMLIALFIEEAEGLQVEEAGIFYGDQERIPTSPAICVEPDDKKSDLYGAGRMTEVDFVVYILCYHSELRAIQSNRRDADRLAERVTTLLNSNANFYGRAIHCFVSANSSGYATKQNNTFRANRITFNLKSQERLPNNP